MIDRSWIGHCFEPLEVDVERGRLRQYARAIGETRPEYVDVAAAQNMGWPDLPVLTPFLFCLEMEQADPWTYYKQMGVDVGRLLHGTQSFEVAEPAWAGEHLQFLIKIGDIYSKKNGALEFIVKDTVVSRGSGSPIANLQSVMILRGEGE